MELTGDKAVMSIAQDSQTSTSQIDANMTSDLDGLDGYEIVISFPFHSQNKRRSAGRRQNGQI